MFNTASLSKLGTTSLDVHMDVHIPSDLFVQSAYHHMFHSFCTTGFHTEILLTSR